MDSVEGSQSGRSNAAGNTHHLGASSLVLGYAQAMPKTIPSTPSSPRPMAPYSIATEAAGLVFISGQVALDPVTGDRAPDDVTAQAIQVLDNIGVILRDVGLDYPDVVKTTIFLADMGDYAAVNDIYGTYFEMDPPARSAIQAAALPAGFLVEIELVAAR